MVEIKLPSVAEPIVLTQENRRLVLNPFTVSSECHNKLLIQHIVNTLCDIIVHRLKPDVFH